MISESEQLELSEFLKRKYKNTDVKCISALQSEYISDVGNFVINGSFIERTGIDNRLHEIQKYRIFFKLVEFQCLHKI